MEIPYTFTPRKDTGLVNSKIGIWLFLASEVMLFGGLFSGYVFLRIYSDYPWPERALPVLPGLINTFVLIGSSVTVVFAWASLKMRQWKRFQIFMGITLVCALLFLVLKGIEYNAKWHHQAIRMADYTIVEGHTHKATLDSHGEYQVSHGAGHGDGHAEDGEGHGAEAAHSDDAHGAEGGDAHASTPVEFPGNSVLFKASEVSFSLVRAHEPYVNAMLKQATAASSRIVLAESIVKYTGKGTEVETKKVLVEAGTELDTAVLKDLQVTFIHARTHNQELRTAELRRLWQVAKKENPGMGYQEMAKIVQLDASVLAKEVIDTPSQVSFKVEPPTTLVFDRDDIRESAETARMKDDTVLRGELLNSPIALGVDALDFRWTAQRAVEAGKTPMAVIEKSWVFSEENEHADGFREVWETHKKCIAVMEEELKKNDREPTDTDRYRLGWKDFVQYARAKKEGVEPGSKEFAALRPSMMEGFAGPNHKRAEYKELQPFLELEVPNKEVGLETVFAPKWNTYYAVYFTLTGLHGLHVIGGALVLGYYLFFSKGLYRSNPEWLANRVEIGGLFWHFVDLVWIFLFPILYLM